MYRKLEAGSRTTSSNSQELMRLRDCEPGRSGSNQRRSLGEGGLQLWEERGSVTFRFPFS